MTPEEKELIALKRLRHQVNRLMWTSRDDQERHDKVMQRLVKVWMVAEARDIERTK